MPRGTLNPVELCRRMRSSAAGEHTYLLLLTDAGNAADVLAGLEAGADDYVSKPFISHELRTRLRAGSRIVELREQLQVARTETQMLQTTDELTGMLNRCSILQALEREMAPRLYALLEAYGRRSGMPVLLNTSLNLAGEPIVNRAVEGYSTFLRSGIDVLVADRTRVTKRGSLLAKRKEALAC